MTDRRALIPLLTLSLYWQVVVQRQGSRMSKAPGGTNVEYAEPLAYVGILHVRSIVQFLFSACSRQTQWYVLGI